MILVDSSVWIDYFRGAESPAADRLDDLLDVEILLTGDLILTEVLQGFRTERDFRKARRLMESFEVIPLAGHDICLQAAENHRALRARGVTVRKTIDTLIATCCIENAYPLLHADRDFDVFERHLGLQVVATER